MGRPRGPIPSDTDDDQNDDLGVTDEEAEQLLADAVEADDESENDVEQSERSGSRSDTDDNKLSDELAKWKSLARKHEKQFKETSSKLAKYEDANKSDRERLEERASTAESRAGTAEAKAKALEIAIDRAPEHATLAQVRAVAKRVRGEDDEALEADADELFELLASNSESKTAPKVAGARPKERLKGGAEPDEEPEETDPRKLAAMLPRRR